MSKALNYLIKLSLLYWGEKIRKGQNHLSARRAQFHVRSENHWESLLWIWAHSSWPKILKHKKTFCWEIPDKIKYGDIFTKYEYLWDIFCGFSHPDQLSIFWNINITCNQHYLFTLRYCLIWRCPWAQFRFVCVELRTLLKSIDKHGLDVKIRVILT